MTRYRAERLVEIARSKGVKAMALATSPAKLGPNSPFLYMVLLRTNRSREAVWCYSTTHFFSTLKTMLAYQPDTPR